MKTDRHDQFVQERAKRSSRYRSRYLRTLRQVDLALLVREMREAAGLTQVELAKKIGSKQSVIARSEGADYIGQSLAMLQRVAAACQVSLKLQAAREPDFEREVALV